jgi:hypothetical protein
VVGDEVVVDGDAVVPWDLPGRLVGGGRGQLKYPAHQPLSLQAGHLRPPSEQWKGELKLKVQSHENFPVLRIHDILVLIRIRYLRIHASDSDPDPVFFVIDLQDANKKLV